MTDAAAWAALLRVHAAVVPVLDRELQLRCGLPLTWYDVLLELNSAPGRRLTMGELGQAAVVSRSRVSRVVGELEAVGLVERVVNDDDRRSSVAVITPDGRRLLRRAAPVYLAGIEREFTRHLGADGPAVAGALERVLEAFGVDFGGEGQPR
jgi:DNA-binding MarR family transcriptional regulator